MAPPLHVNSLYLAPGLYIAAARDGAIVSSLKGIFRLAGLSGRCLIREVLPALYGNQFDHAKRGNCEISDPSLASTPAFYNQLEQAGIISRFLPKEALSAAPKRSSGVYAWHDTPRIRRIADELAAHGIRTSKSLSGDEIVVVDLSGLDVRQSLEVAGAIHERGCRSLSIWRRGPETFYGPLVEPHRSPCWNCCRLRLSDTILGKDDDSVADDIATARITAENILLALRFPAVAPFGCVVIDDERTCSLHSIVPMPYCPICNATRSASAPRGAALSHSFVVPRELLVLADPRGGVLRHIRLYTGAEAEAPAMPLCCSVLISPYTDENVEHSSSNGEGKGATQEDAVRSAIGEGIERYAASLWDLSKLTHAPFRELADRAFDPRWLVLYEDWQYTRPDFPFSRFRADQALFWTEGRWLDTYEPVFTPALATYMNFPARDAERFCQATSNGLATGITFEDAALRALYELIERDAFMLFWLARRAATRIAIDGCEPLISQALKEVGRLGARIEVYVVDTGIQHPTIVCLGFGDGLSWPGVTIGLGTHADPDIALRRAVLEHGHYGPYIRRLMGEGLHQNTLRAEDVARSLDHAFYYVHASHVAGLKSFCGSGTDVVSLDDLRLRYRQAATLATCVSCLSEAGIRAAAVDVTSPDIAIAPLRVVRAFGINMQPIHFGYANQRLRNPRLDRLLSGGEAETTPHPIA